MWCSCRLSAVAALSVTVFVATPALFAGDSATASAGKQLRAAQAAVDAAHLDLARLRGKLKAQISTQPQWAPLMNELKAAQTEMETCKRVALQDLSGNPEYQRLQTERRQAQDDLAGANPSTARGAGQIEKNADLVLKDGIALRNLEDQILNRDQKFNDAKARLAAARSKLDDLDAEIDHAVREDPEYAAIQERLTAAQQQVNSARQQLASAAQADRQAREQKEHALENSDWGP